MDRGQFDTLARLVSRRQSRRAALAMLLGAALLRHAPVPAVAKPKGKGKKKGKRRRKLAPLSPPPSLPIVEACFTGADCIPGQGAVNEDCDFSQTALFPNLDAHGAVLSRSNFTGAHLAGADLRGAVLEDACFVGANLSNARLDNSTVLDGAIFCRTLMPDGSINDRDCDRGTACCPTPPPICQREVCAGDCISTINQLCSIFGNPCCDQGVCIPELVNPLFTFCQWPCDTDSDCTSVFGGGVVCGHDVNFCLGMGGDDKCCRPA